jgi:hypothetical protein
VSEVALCGGVQLVEIGGFLVSLCCLLMCENGMLVTIYGTFAHRITTSA